MDNAHNKQWSSRLQEVHEVFQTETKVGNSLFKHTDNMDALMAALISTQTQHSLKGKKEDILKAIHYLEMIIERDYESTTI